MSKRAYSCHVLSRYICYGIIGMSAPSLHRESTDPTMNTQHQSCVYVRSNEITVVMHTFSRQNTLISVHMNWHYILPNGTVRVLELTEISCPSLGRCLETAL